MARASWREMLTLNAYWVGLSFMWNSLHALVLPAVLLALVPEESKNTYLGLLTFAGLFIAMLVQPASGALSDRWTSRWGRRRPLIALGTLFDLAFLALLGLAAGVPGLAIGYIGLQLSSNVAHGPLQGLLPDRVPPTQLGTASGLKNLFDMAGLVAASLLVGRLLPPGVRQPVAAVAVITVVLAASAALTLFGVREAPALPGARTPSKPSSAGLSWKAITDHVRAHSGFWWLIAARFVFLAGIYGIQAFALYYLRDVLRARDPARLTGDLLAAIALTLMAFALIGGWLVDRFGARRLLVAASAFAGLGCLLLLMARSAATVLAFGSVVGVGVGLFVTANWALANTLAPVEEAGKFLGLTNLATAGAGALVRLEGPLIDVLNAARPGAFWGYTLLFIFGAAATLGSAVLLPWVGRGGQQPRKVGFDAAGGKAAA